MNEIIRFFINGQFSKDMIALVNKDNLEENEQTKLFNYCIKKAWDDAWMNSKGEDLYKNHSNTYIEYLKTKIKDDQIKNDNTYDSWHRSTVTSENIKDENKKEIRNEMNVGRWQKFINMTMKYLFCCKDKFSDDKYQFIKNIPWDCCHFILDSLTLDWYYREVNNSNKKVKWTQIDDYGTYQNIQDTVRKYLADKKEKDKMSPLIFEFYVWPSEKIRRATKDLASIVKYEEDINAIKLLDKDYFNQKMIKKSKCILNNIPN